MAKRQAIERAAAEKAAQDAQMAHDRKITQEAAALARADAEKKAAEDAAKAKEEAEKATATAASEAAAAATTAAHEAAAKEKKDAEEAAAKAQKEAEEAEAKANEPPPPPPPPEKKKPIKFKDAVGRKFSFPFELCATWRVSVPPRDSSVLVLTFHPRGWRNLFVRLFCTLKSLDLMWPRVTTI